MERNDIYMIQRTNYKEMTMKLLEHIDLLKNYYGEKLAVALSRKYVCWYSKNFYDAKRFRENYMKISDYQEALTAIENYFNQNEGRTE